MSTQKKYFYCYSIQLKNFFKLQGISYESRFRHNKSGNQCWVYIEDDQLANALLDWNEYKKLFWKEKKKNNDRPAEKIL